MQPYSDYEIAQRRIAERRANKSRFQFLLALIAILVFITLISGGSVLHCAHRHYYGAIRPQLQN